MNLSAPAKDVRKYGTEEHTIWHGDVTAVLDAIPNYVEIAKSRISGEKTVGTFIKSAYQDVVEVLR